MTDYLKQLVDDYNDGIVDLTDTLNRLEFLDWKENKKPMPEDYAKVPLDPLDIIIEQERQEQLNDALAYLKAELSPQNWSIVVMIAEGKNYNEIGAALGITHQAVSKHMDTIRKSAGGLDVLLRKEPPRYEAGTPKVKVTYPSDAAMRGKRCEMPEYLQGCFPDSNRYGNTICCYCEKCKRKTANKT